MIVSYKEPKAESWNIPDPCSISTGSFYKDHSIDGKRWGLCWQRFCRDSGYTECILRTKNIGLCTCRITLLVVVPTLQINITFRPFSFWSSNFSFHTECSTNIFFSQ